MKRFITCKGPTNLIKLDTTEMCINECERAIRTADNHDLPF